MIPYLCKTPRVLQWLHPEAWWKLPARNKEVYLTFDDGPHPEVTAWVIDELAAFNAKATFFFVGEQSNRFPGWPEKLRALGHAVGHHTHRHVNGWEMEDQAYLDDVEAGAEAIGGRLFRPPYGRIRRSQIRLIHPRYRVVMWHVISGDFDSELEPEVCTQNVLKAVEPGSIVVFHDSPKAWPRLKETLPEVLKELSRRGYVFLPIPTPE